MSNVTIKLNSSGIQKFLRDEAVRNLAGGEAKKIAAKANGNYKVSTITAGTRCIATVEAADLSTRKDNYKNNTLLKAMGGGV